MTTDRIDSQVGISGSKMADGVLSKGSESGNGSAFRIAGTAAAAEIVFRKSRRLIGFIELLNYSISNLTVSVWYGFIATVNGAI